MSRRGEQFYVEMIMYLKIKSTYYLASRAILCSECHLKKNFSDWKLKNFTDKRRKNEVKQSDMALPQSEDYLKLLKRKCIIFFILFWIMVHVSNIFQENKCSRTENLCTHAHTKNWAMFQLTFFKIAFNCVIWKCCAKFC